MNEAVFCTDYIRKLCKNVEFCYSSVTFSAGVAFAHQPDDVIHDIQRLAILWYPEGHVRFVTVIEDDLVLYFLQKFCHVEIAEFVTVSKDVVTATAFSRAPSISSVHTPCIPSI